MIETSVSSAPKRPHVRFYWSTPLPKPIWHPARSQQVSAEVKGWGYRARVRVGAGGLTYGP